MKNLIIILLLFCSQVFSQKIEFANAENGLIVRDAPSLKSNRIGKLDYGTRVEIVNKTGVKLEIKDEQKIIKGEWTKVKGLTNNVVGFVFSGFLTDKALDKESEYENYYLTKIPKEASQKYWKNASSSIKPEPIHIFLRDSNHKDLFKILIPELELYDNTVLSVKKIEGLKNIEKIIVIESTSSACCSSSDEYYLLVDLNNNLIELPKVDNTHCDGPEPFFGYIFPKDKNGKDARIIYAKIIPDENNKEDKVEILKTYSWNGSSYIQE